MEFFKFKKSVSALFCEMRSVIKLKTKKQIGKMDFISFDFSKNAATESTAALLKYSLKHIEGMLLSDRYDYFKFFQ